MYSLRFPAKLRRGRKTWLTYLLFDDYEYRTRDNLNPSYFTEGFLAIQNAIARVWFEISQPMNMNMTMTEIQMQRFPTPAHSIYIMANEYWVHVFFLLGLNYTFVNIVRYISIEKEKQLKEAMRIMGVAGWMHYLGWFIRSIVMLSIVMLSITIILKVRVTYELLKI